MTSVITGEGRLSQLLIDADLAMGAFNVTLSAGQTVDGKDVSTLPKAFICANLMSGVDTEDVDTGGTPGWQVHPNFLSSLYVGKAGTYTLHASIRCKCDNAARPWQVTIDGKIIDMGNNTSGAYTVLTASLAAQSLTVGWKTVHVRHQEEATSRTYRVTAVDIAIVED